MINPVLEKALGSIARWALGLGVPFLVESGIWTPAEATEYVTWGSLSLVALGWSLWEKYKTRLNLVTALGTGPTTEAAVKQMVSAGESAPVTTPKHDIPAIPAPRTFKQ